MSFHRLISVIRRLLGRERALARCPVPKGRKASIILMTAVLMAGRVATATVAVTGVVVPTDNPLPRANGTNPNEGLPSNGNSISPFVPAGSQTLYEGIVDPTNSASNLNIDEIIVGRSSFGAMAITGESTLR